MSSGRAQAFSRKNAHLRSAEPLLHLLDSGGGGMDLRELLLVRLLHLCDIDGFSTDHTVREYAKLGADSRDGPL